MRRVATIYGLLCLLAFGGAGQPLAAASCPHAAIAPLVAATAITPDHACCHARGQHGARAADQHAAAHQQTHAATHAPAQASDEYVAPDEQAAHQSAPFCAHCMGRSAPAPSGAVSRSMQTAKRADVAQTAAIRQTDTRARTDATRGRPPQHAPPGRVRHLLLSTLLI